MAAAKRFVAVFERNRVARRFLGEETSPIESCRSKRKRRRNDEGNRQGVDRRENRRYRSGRGDRGANEGEEREIARRLEARPRTRGSLRPIAWSPRPATARANRGRARPTPAAGAGLRLPRGHAPPPESARASRVTAPPRAKSIDQWPGTRTRAWFNAGDGHCLLPPRGGGVGVGTKDLRGAHPSAPPPSGARTRSTAREADDERGAVSSADTCEQQFSRIIPVA